MSENIKYLNDSNFPSEIQQGVTLVDFYADWCGPCRQIAPIVEELADELKGTAHIAKVDVETAPETASGFGVTSIPTLILFKDGKELKRVVGIKDKDSLKSMIETAL